MLLFGILTTRDRLHRMREGMTVSVPVTCRAEGDQVGRVIGSALRPWRDVMDLQEACVGAARGLATVTVASQYPAAHRRCDGMTIDAEARVIDAGVAQDSLGIRPAQGQVPAAGGDR